MNTYNCEKTSTEVTSNVDTTGLEYKLTFSKRKNHIIDTGLASNMEPLARKNRREMPSLILAKNAPCYEQKKIQKT